MTSAQLAEVMKKLDEVSKRQDEYNNQYLSNSYNTKPTDSSVPASFSDATSAQGLLLDDLNKMVATLKISVEQLADQIYQNQRHLDDLEQYSRSNCLILHGCTNLPEKKASNLDFENFVLKTLNSRIKLSQPIINTDIDICHVLPSRKAKNPIIIKFVRRTVRNLVFANKSQLKAAKNSDPKLSLTESLTKRRFQLLAKSQEAFRFQNVWTLKGNIYCYFEGKRHYIDDFGDISKIRFPC